MILGTGSFIGNFVPTTDNEFLKLLLCFIVIYYIYIMINGVVESIPITFIVILKGI